VLSPEDAKLCPPQVTTLITKNPRLALAKLLNLWADAKQTAASIHPSAVIGKNVELGDNLLIEAGVVVGDNCKLGNNTQLKANVTLYNNVTIGANCTVHSGTVIGSDGFGYAVDTDGSWFKMLHLGGVVIGDNVEIGSNTSIDRGMIDNTVIGNNVIIDNLVQIGHNVVIGDRTAIAGCTGVAGSTVIGKNCLIGGASSIAGHITIGDRVNITGTSAVNHSLLEPGVYSSGFPAKENGVWRRNVARFMMLDNMAKRLKELEKALEKTMVGL
jgi:UDP-3-O-[3-hydroxymyristoyl] glucosamine N-acyltransferase